jgi:hypothetical protein
VLLREAQLQLIHLLQPLFPRRGFEFFVGPFLPAVGVELDLEWRVAGMVRLAGPAEEVDVAFLGRDQVCATQTQQSELHVWDFLFEFVQHGQGMVI